VTHCGDVSEEGVQLLVGVKDTVLGKIIGRRYRPYAFTPCLLVDRLGTAIRRHCRVANSVHGQQPASLESRSGALLSDDAARRASIVRPRLAATMGEHLPPDPGDHLGTTRRTRDPTTRMWLNAVPDSSTRLNTL
jgi:hypothetical protein